MFLSSSSKFQILYLLSWPVAQRGGNCEYCTIVGVNACDPRECACCATSRRFEPWSSWELRLLKFFIYYYLFFIFVFNIIILNGPILCEPRVGHHHDVVVSTRWTVSTLVEPIPLQGATPSPTESYGNSARSAPQWGRGRRWRVRTRVVTEFVFSAAPDDTSKPDTERKLRKRAVRVRASTARWERVKTARG